MNIFTGRDKDSENVLHALLPGARINKDSHKITINVGTSNHTIVFNIGGTRFETYKSTLNRLPFSPLANENFLKKHYRPDKGDYFFDREPDAFKAILNYLRTGELHLPAWMCGASIKTELHFWGVEEDEIEECCWTSYNSWTTTLESLKTLEKDMKRTLGHQHETEEGPQPRWRHLCNKGWALMNNPTSSSIARVFSMVSVSFVLLSIFSFCAETHEHFHVFGKRSDVTTNVTNLSDVITNITNPYGVNSTLENIQSEKEPLVHPILFELDIICMIYFLIEFVTRFILCPHKLKFFFYPMTMIDIAALIPDIIDVGARFATSNFQSRYILPGLAPFRFTRIFRIMRLVRTFPGLWILFYTLRASLKELMLMMLFLGMGMLVYASLIYFADDRDTFTSIPTGFWWALITMTTVGYGDMYPVTKLGYLIGSATAISGLLMIGFTVPILVNNFIMYYSHTQSSMERERKREERIKKAIEDAKERRPSLLDVVFGSKLQRQNSKKKETIELTSLRPVPEEDVKENTLDTNKDDGCTS